MSLELALNTALSGLNIGSRALSVLSHNIANANTEGYSRQQIQQQSLYVDGLGSGVTIGEITRRVDEYLERSIRDQTSLLGQISTLNNYANRTQLLLGAPGTGSDVGSFVTGYFNSLESLALQPESVSRQSAAVGAAVSLTRELSNLADGLHDLRFQADQDISAAVTNINSILAEMYENNQRIAGDRLAGRSTAGIEDRQYELTTELASYLNISTFEKENGQTIVFTSNGVSLVDEIRHELRYSPAAGKNSFINDAGLSALTVVSLDTQGNQIGQTVTLVSGGSSSQVVNPFTTGSLSALFQTRDTDIPAVLAQFDQFAATIRDRTNAIHNTGTGYPGVSSFSGSRLINAADFSEWEGNIRIALLDGNGNPASSLYSNQAAAAPFNLNLSTLDTGLGPGVLSTQGIIDAINQFYAPRNKVSIGNLSDVQLVSRTTTLPSGADNFSFEFDVQNLSANASNFYLSNVTVQDNNGVTLGTPTTTQPSFDVTSYDTQGGSQTVTVNITGGTTGLSEGDIVYLSNPGLIVDGIPASELTGYFTVTNLTATGFDVVTSTAASAGITQVPGVTTSVLPPYSTIDPYTNQRTGPDGVITADLSANPTSPFYTISATIGVDDGTGNIVTSTVTYRIANNQINLLNDYYGAQTANGSGTIVTPSSATPQVQALLVDENGNELTQTAGRYSTSQDGYLVIRATDGTQVIAIDSLDSLELGRPDTIPIVEASNRGFSHYFGLNNFFEEVETGADTTRNAALNLRVEQRIIDVPNRISTGVLVQSATTPYAFRRNVGDNTIATALSSIAEERFTFLEIGGLGRTVRTAGDYVGQILAFAANRAVSLEANATNTEQLRDGLDEERSGISGVTLDNELANTIIYQNAYSASARIITVADELFDTLLQAT